MGQSKTVATDGSGDNHSAADLETIVVDADDIITAFERNRRDENEQRSHVLRVSPPFEGEKTATLHVSEPHTRYPPEVQAPLHLSPEQFVGEDKPRTEDAYKVPRYSEQRGMFLDENGYTDDETGEYLEWTDEMEAEFEEWWDVSTEVWESTVRADLRDEITLRQRTASSWIETTVEIRYEDDE